jgi:uncharacterized protein YjbI with pentapeptide repeats
MPAPTREPIEPSPGSRLRADCARCCGLCCVAPGFSASADFAIDKPAGQPCPHLQTDFRCGIHEHLRKRGFPGCAVYDCFGAGQQVVQVTFAGQDWRTPRIAAQVFTVFTIMRQLHELLWYLTEALGLEAASSLNADLRLALDATERLTRMDADALARLDVAAHRRDVNVVLLRTSELARAGVRHRARDYRGADLTGKSLRGADLRAANLRGAFLIGADLGGADLRLADVTGADFRGADFSGADLAGSLFLTQSQLDSAMGDRATKLSPRLIRPTHWSSTPKTAGASNA